ncbi:protein transport protein SEC31, putative [Plasmodium gallinaceum]|uniref:Protein transport protein SEC31, putative n=1 Tax=Plasmodium gallinaceum TaxID=5849 RepID=A0A1J1GSQ8_PLAGA|nr:protein transport protein SEC31, putative [Plasmodium gallinaceum]CRG94344.1 protein transport protein SEC31, putative [Plasmodium gallinaceum]
MALKSININGNFDWCPFEEYKNYLICFNSHNLLYSNNNNINNYIYLLDINLNNDSRNIEIVNKLNFEDALKNESDGSSNISEYVTCFEWINSNNFVETENEDELNKGIIVGGLTNGDIVLLNPQNLFEKNLDYENFIINKVNVHDNSINCLEFNRHKNHLIATGGNDGQLFITDIENIYSPTSYDPYLDKNNLQKINCLNWNRKVSHILATSSNNGNTVIWDLKIKKSAVSFRDPHSRTKTSSLCWLANQPTQILVSYDDDRNPCLQLWDLRNSNYPIKEIIGHSKGINNICFSNIDTNLLLSSGKDITKCWYLNNNNFDIFNEINNSANNIYSKWSPFIPDIFASSTNMDTIQINSINNGNKMTTKYIPNFYIKDSGICFGFGGKICCFNNSSISSSSTSLHTSAIQNVHKNINNNEDNEINKMKNKKLENKFLIKCHIYPTEMELISEADNFEKYITNGNYKEFCESKIMKSDDDHEKLTWKILQLLYTSQKSEIVKELGYDISNIIQKIMYNIGKQPGFIFKNILDKDISINDISNNLDENNDRDYNNITCTSNLMNDNNLSSSNMGDNIQKMNGSFDVDPEKFFRELGEKTEHEKSKEKLSIQNNSENEDDYNSNSRDDNLDNKKTYSDWNTGIESIIKECVLVGNIETAVELCLHKDRMADALLLASFGGEQLWHKTKTIYINKQNDNFLRNINYILDNKLDLLVNNIDLSSWGEALSILCTYAINNPNFNNLCETLAKRLQNEKFDIRAASICYLCACNFSETVEIWNNMPSKKASLLNVLQDLVEKMTVLKMVIKYDQFNPIMNQKINQYAELLANSGRLKAAMTFLCLIQDDQSLESLILRDRIFNSANHILGQQIEPPILPFQVVDIKPSPTIHQNLLYNQGQQLNQNQQFNQSFQYNQSQQYKQNLSNNPNQPKLYNQQNLQRLPPPISVSQISSTHINQNQLVSNNYNSQVINNTVNRSSFLNTTNQQFSSNVNTIQSPTNIPSYMPPNIPSNTSPVNTPPFSPPSKFSNFNTTQKIQDQEKQQSSMFNQSYTNINKSLQNNMPSSNVAPSVAPVVPPSNTLNQINNRPSFSRFQNITAPPRNNNPPTSSSANLVQPNINQPQENQYSKRECFDQQIFDPNNISSIPPNNNMQTKVFQNSFQDNTNKVNFQLNSNTSSLSGINITSPIAGALTVTPGMPIPWPIPTTTQQLGSTTQSTANENKKIQTATKEQNGVLMNKNNIDSIKKSINNLLNIYISQEPVKKKAEDVSAKVFDLFEKLDNGSFNEQINDNIINLCNFINANDFKTTNKIIVDLSRNLWDSSNKSWIMGLKRIIPKC